MGSASGCRARVPAPGDIAGLSGGRLSRLRSFLCPLELARCGPDGLELVGMDYACGSTPFRRRRSLATRGLLAEQENDRVEHVLQPTIAPGCVVAVRQARQEPETQIRYRNKDKLVVFQRVGFTW